MTPVAEAEMNERAMRRRSLVSTVAVTLAVTTIVALAGAGSSPITSKGKRRKGIAKADPLAVLVAAQSPSAAPSSSLAALPPLPSSSVVPAVVAPAPVITSKLTIGPGTKVLVFGDSMVDAGFAHRLGKLVAEKGGTVVHDAWTSSTTSTWSKGERLDNLLVVHRPDVVIIALGANEVFLPAPEAVAPRVRSIVAKVSPRPCIWVSPPLWKGETGIVAVERNNAGHCGFFDSGNVKVERAKDGIHPTPKGGSDWADAVFGAVVK